MININQIYEFRTYNFKIKTSIPIIWETTCSFSQLIIAYGSDGELISTKVIPISLLLASNKNWRCVISETNSLKEMKPVEHFGLTKITSFHKEEDPNIDDKYIDREYIIINKDFLWECSQSISNKNGMICNNPKCKEHSLWADGPNIGDKFLCYSCKTNPITRTILGY